MSRSREEILKEIAKLKKELDDVPCEFCGVTPIYAKGLCRNCYHRYLRNGSPEYAKKKKKPDVEEIPYRIKIAKKVLGNIPYNVPLDFDESIDYALGTLQERERDIVERNAKGESMRSIAKTYGVTAQFISYLSARAYRKLLRQRPLNIIKYGINEADII